MSTTPPPYQFDQKAARKAAAFQAKAARDTYRAQRDLLRHQQRALRRGSILGPILLVGAGVAALLLSTGRWNALAFTSFYARWWPVLFVLAGVILLAEWAYDQYLAHTSTPPLRRRIGGGATFLLILAAIFGATSRTVHDQHDLILNAFSINPGNFAEFFGDKQDLPPQILDQALPPLTPGLTLTVDNPRGDILITGKSNDGNLHITVNKHVFASRSGGEGGSGFFGGGRGGAGGGARETAADTALPSAPDQLTPVFVASPDGLSLSVPSHGGDSADLILLVPDSLALVINAHRGDTTITGIKAPITITSSRGDIELHSITGNVIARLSRNNDSFLAHNITGDINLRGTVGDVAVTDITGQTYLEGGFYGDTHFERLYGPLTFQSTKTHLTLARLEGNLDINSDSISGDKLVGPINLRVNSRNIDFDDVSGDLDLTDSNGIVNITSRKPGNISVLNTNSAINLTIPDRTGFTLTALANNGTITNDFNLPTTNIGDHTTFSTTVGDGKNHINLQTTHSNINLHKGPPLP